MKNMKKFLGIIAILEIVGFGLVACDNGNGGGGYNDLNLSIGDTGPGGGIVFYKKAAVSDGWRYLEAAPEDHETDISWCSCSYSSSGYCYVTTTGTAIGTGKANNAAIIAATHPGGTLTASNCAAKACADYRGGGKSDWFLPSNFELNEMYMARTHLGIWSGVFWSSSQYDDNYQGAWGQDFDDGGQRLYIAKYGNRSVRAVRAF